MYGWIWRMLPFGIPGKIIGSVVLLVGVVYLLWYHVFPAVEPLLPFDDVQLESSPPPPGGGSAPGGPGSPPASGPTGTG